MPDQAVKQSDTKTPDQSAKYKIKVDGQEKEVSYDELIELAQKGDDYTQKTQTLAEKEKTLKDSEEEIKDLKAVANKVKANPKLAEAVNKVFSDFESGKLSKSDVAKDRGLKTLDKLIQEADDPTQKENLREMRTIIAEETGTQDLKDEVSKLRNELSILKQASLVGLNERVESQLKKLEGEFGEKIVGKYRKDITAMALKYPHQTVKKIFYHFADDLELETTLLERAKKREKEELERKKAGAGPEGAGVTGKVEIPRDKAGRVNMRQLLQNIKEKHGFSG